MLGIVFLGGCIALIVAYATFGRFLTRQFNIDEKKATPAVTMADGVDFVVTRRPILFGHHFSSIAGAGPIVGPIIAAGYFGWGPTVAWVLLGAIFIGGVHDFAALVMSVRHRARSVAEICRVYLNPITYRFFLIFIWLALVYVLIVFLDLTALTYAPPRPEMLGQGGVVATASILYIVLAATFGLCMRRFGLSLFKGSLIFVPLVFVTLAVAHWAPLTADMLPAPIRGNPKYTWSILLIGYCFVASITPVNILLQPRDYLSSYLLFACLVFGGLGLVLGSFTGNLPANLEFFKGIHPENAPYLFPMLFITVACGACSGFHSLVSSGTTAKQLPDETAARPIAYGGMLTEGALAVIAMATLVVVGGSAAGTPTATFAQGIGMFLASFGLPAHIGTAFGLLAVSTFLLTTLDTCTRLTRYLVEEFLNLRGPRWRYLSTIVTILPLLFFACVEFPNPKNPAAMIPAWRAIWPAFGTTNQLLAALALLVIVIWRKSQGRSIWFVAWPMVFMMITTCTSMVMLIKTHLFADELTSRLIGWVNVVMMAMTVVLVVDTVLSWGKLGARSAPDEAGAEAATG